MDLSSIALEGCPELNVDLIWSFIGLVFGMSFGFGLGYWTGTHKDER